MLSCKDVALQASSLIDGDLGPWDTLQIRLHLAVCKGCGRFIHQMRVTRSLTEAAGQSDISDLHADDARISAILAQVQDQNPNEKDISKKGPER